MCMLLFMLGHPLTQLYKEKPREAVSHVAQAYLAAGCDMTATAGSLGVVRGTLYLWLKQWPELQKAMTLARSEYAREQVKRLRDRRKTS